MNIDFSLRWLGFSSPVAQVALELPKQDVQAGLDILIVLPPLPSAGITGTLTMSGFFYIAGNPTQAPMHASNHPTHWAAAPALLFSFLFFRIYF